MMDSSKKGLEAVRDALADHRKPGLDDLEEALNAKFHEGVAKREELRGLERSRHMVMVCGTSEELVKHDRQIEDTKAVIAALDTVGREYKRMRDNARRDSAPERLGPLIAEAETAVATHKEAHRAALAAEKAMEASLSAITTELAMAVGLPWHAARVPPIRGDVREEMKRRRMSLPPLPEEVDEPGVTVRGLHPVISRTGTPSPTPEEGEEVDEQPEEGEWIEDAEAPPPTRRS